MKAYQRGNAIDSQRGSALALALLAVTFVALLGAGFVSVSGSLAKRQTAEVEKIQAFYLAEAGLAESFQAVRIQRTGQVGSEEAPASFGDGLVWVDATQGDKGQVELRSNALFGAGRASLSLVVEPVEISLGFFGNEAVVIESVILVDGFDSQQGGYSTQLSAPTVSVDPLQSSYADDVVNQILFYDDKIYRYLSSDGCTYQVDLELSASEYSPKAADDDGVLLLQDLLRAMDQGDGPLTDLLLLQRLLVGGEGDDGGYGDFLATIDSMPSNVGGQGDRLTSEQGPTTGGGGLVASNGDVIFQNAVGDPVEVFGDVFPGPGGCIEGLDGVTISGSTIPRADVLDLPAVVVPEVSMDPAIRHDGVLPFVVPSGTAGYSSLTVAQDAELILRGPATVVIGELDLEPGATLTLDTRNGNVDLYVTAGMNLAEGAYVVAEKENDNTTSIQVAEIETVGDAPVQLNAQSEFHGTIYSPSTDVRVGGDFEVFGGIVASRLEIGAGARLHFDDIAMEGTPIPRIIGWRIVEIPRSVANMRDGRRVLGLENIELLPLGQAHDLAAVELKVSYLDDSGVSRSYSGPEDQFDWDRVASVIEVRRNSAGSGSAGGAQVEAGPELPIPDEGLVVDLRPEVEGAVKVVEAVGWYFGGDLFTKALEPHHPLSAKEWEAIRSLPDGLSAENQQTLRDRDIAAGGTGGL